MADDVKVRVDFPGEGSAEIVAFRLMERIAAVEDKALFSTDNPGKRVNREWILSTYAHCISAIKNPQNYRK